jgi:cytidylate kinase
VARAAAAASVDAKRAEKAVHDSDRDREDFLKRFYDVAHESAWHYDLVVNTDLITTQQAADLIITAAKM